MNIIAFISKFSFFKPSFILLLFFSFFVYKPSHAEDVKVGLEIEANHTTLTAQSYKGWWNIQLYKKFATGTVVLEKEIKTTEDVILVLTHSGITVRAHGEPYTSEAYDRVNISGGKLISLDFPSTHPIMCEGRIEVTHDKKKLIVTNVVPFKDFVLSVASSEVMSCEPEAMKAHIIALETKIRYLMSHTKHKNEPYDLCGNKHHCVNFIGAGTKKELIELIYASLKHHSIYYKKNLINPRFHHTCGGKISSAKDIYNTDDEPYHVALSDIKDNKGSENCFHSPSFHWALEIPLVTIIDFLSIEFAAGDENIYVKFDVLNRNSEGRITKLRLFGLKVKEISGIDFFPYLQEFYGINSFKSMRFTYENLRRSMIVKGMGEGDGVGMCLYGADGLAKKGLNYEEILNFYYSGITLK